jgi:hypothetical protein
MQATPPFKLIHMVLNPPNALLNETVSKKKFSMFAAIIIDSLWKLKKKKKKMKKKKEKWDISKEAGEPIRVLIKIVKRLEKHSRAYNSSHTQTPTAAMQKWIKPPPGKIKINVDAASGGLQACCAAVIRNSKCQILKLGQPSWIHAVHSWQKLRLFKVLWYWLKTWGWKI